MLLSHSYCYVMYVFFFCCFFFKQKTAYEMRISDWSSDVCSSDLLLGLLDPAVVARLRHRRLGRRHRAAAGLEEAHQITAGARQLAGGRLAADTPVGRIGRRRCLAAGGTKALLGEQGGVGPVAPPVGLDQREAIAYLRHVLAQHGTGLGR